MSQVIKLSATERAAKSDGIPGVIYGPDIEKNILVEVEYNQLNKILNTAGFNKIVNVEVGGTGQEVLFKDIQYDPVTNNVIHFDLYAIKRGQKMRADIPVVIIGESPAVQRGAVLNQFVDEIEVECIPSKLPESFEIDVSKLDEVGAVVSTDDIEIEEGVELLVDEHLTIARVEEVQELKVEDEGPVDGPSEEAEEGEEAVEGEAAEAEEGEAEEGDDAQKADEKSSE